MNRIGINGAQLAAMNDSRARPRSRPAAFAYTITSSTGARATRYSRQPTATPKHKPARADRSGGTGSGQRTRTQLRKSTRCGKAYDFATVYQGNTIAEVKNSTTPNRATYCP